MKQIRSKPAFPRKATGKTWVFQERQKANQQIAGADKNIDIKTRRLGHRQAQFYISNKSIFNNFLLRLKFSFHDILSVKCKLLHDLLEGVNHNPHEVGIVYFNSKSFPILLGCSRIPPERETEQIQWTIIPTLQADSYTASRRPDHGM